MKLQVKQAIFAKNVGLLLDRIFQSPFTCTLGDAYRSAEQAEINAKKGIGIKNSLHCKRLAIDLNLFNNDGEYLTSGPDYQCFGEYWKSLHPLNRWGGDFKLKDFGHFEMQDL